MLFDVNDNIAVNMNDSNYVNTFSTMLQEYRQVQQQLEADWMNANTVDAHLMDPNWSRSENNPWAKERTSPENLAMQIAQQKEESRKRVEDIKSSQVAGMLRTQAAQKQQAAMGVITPVAGAEYKVSTDFLGL